MYESGDARPSLSYDLCNAAWKLIKPAIAAAAQDRTLNKFAGTIVVLNPEYDERDDHSHEPIVLYSDTLDAFHENALKYKEIALSKALVTKRTGMPSSLVQTQYPYLYREGDTKWGGSTIDTSGLIVAFSGVQAVYDEMIAEWMASTIRALSRNEMTRPDGVMASDSAFIGQ